MQEVPVTQTPTTPESTGTFLGSETFGIISKLVLAIVVVILFIVVAKLVVRFTKNKILQLSDLHNQEQGEKVANLIGDIVFYTLMIFAVFIWFQILGMDVGLILGWVSFWVWLAFKEVLGNMIAGIMILSTKQLNIGDVIEVKNSDNIFWRIEEITIRYTVIRTLDMRQVVLPNMTLINTPIKTFSAEEIVRIDDAVQVDYTTDLALAQKVVIEAINQVDRVQAKDATRTAIKSFDDSGITITYYYYFDPKAGILADYLKWIINESINNTFNAYGISIPFPHTTLVTKEWSQPVNIDNIHITKQQRPTEEEIQQVSSE